MSADVFIYTRVSTDMQREASCDDQERKVREYLTGLGIDHNHAVVLRDLGASGTKDDRPEFRRLWQMLPGAKHPVVAVDDVSRFSRGDLINFIHDVQFSGGRFISAGEQSIDMARPGWELPAEFMGIQNRQTIRELGRQVQRGQEGRVLDGNGSAGDSPMATRRVTLTPRDGYTVSPGVLLSLTRLEVGRIERGQPVTLG